MHGVLRVLFVGLLLVIGCLTSGPISNAHTQVKIVVGRLSGEQVSKLQKTVPGAKLIAVGSSAEALTQIEDADALIGFADEALVRKGKRLRWIQVLSAGVDRYRYKALVDSDITLTNAKIIQGPNVADQAMALLLVLTRQVHRAVRLGPKDGWDNTRTALRAGKTIELAGKLMLVVGYGGIGSAIAERGHGFGMRIEAIDPKPEKPHPTWVEAIHLPQNLLEALPRADVVVVAVPLTAETENMFNTEAFAAMKTGSYLVNIARGKVVDTPALMHALESGKLAGAGLDVTEPEPLPQGHPLWQLDNVVITPHMGGTSDQVMERRLELVEHNLRAFVAGEALRNVVDKRRGY